MGRPNISNHISSVAPFWHDAFVRVTVEVLLGGISLTGVEAAWKTSFGEIGLVN